MNVLEYLHLALRYRCDPLFSKFLAGRRVLDIGAGRGEFVAKDPERFVGVELDTKLVDICVQKGLSVYCMDALMVDFPDGSFEAVHAAQLIEHFSSTDAVRFLTEASRVLARGGVIYLTTPGCRSIWNTFSHIRPYPPQAFVKLLGSATENYLRTSTLNLTLEGFWGNRYFFENKGLTLLSRLLDILFPPKDPIGWTIVLKKTE
jgi:SAM-dependent methyltransferase